jgi:phage FluMu protein Com
MAKQIEDTKIKIFTCGQCGQTLASPNTRHTYEDCLNYQYAKMTPEERIQCLLMDFEGALWKKCPKCGVYKKQNWSPNEWSVKFAEALKLNKEMEQK